jgi:hypothetical protein
MSVLSKVGNKLAYTDKDTGEIVAEFRKNWTEDKLMLIMKQWDDTSVTPEPVVAEIVEEE